jgi:hypothetical protein
VLDPAVLADAGVLDPAVLADATAFAFGDVYRTALVLIALGWCLVWTLRHRPQPASVAAEVEHLEPAGLELVA